MSSQILPKPVRIVSLSEPHLNEQAQFAEEPRTRTGPGRGVLTGIAIGAGLWGLIAIGVVEILKR